MDRNRAGIDMAGTGVFNIAGPTGPGFQCDCGIAPVGRRRDRIGKRAALKQGADGGRQSVDHRLIARLNLPEIRNTVGGATKPLGKGCPIFQVIFNFVKD